MIRIVAFDLALTVSGYATPEESGTFSPPNSAASGIPRLAWIRDQILNLAQGADLAVIEGYSFASRGRAIIALGELGGVVRLALREDGIPFVEIPPSCRAKYAVGKGNAGKNEVLVAAVHRLKYSGHDHNEADALWLRAMALSKFGMGGAPEMPKANREALAKIKWPFE